MSALLIVLGIFVLAGALIALGLGLSRRSQRRAAQGEVAPPRPAPPGRPPSRPPAPPAPPKPVVVEEAEPDVLVVPEVEVEPEVVEEVEVVEAPRLRDRLGKTRAAFVRSLTSVRGRGTVDDETWDELEETLLLADVGLPTTTRILDSLRERARSQRISDADALVDALHVGAGGAARRERRPHARHHRRASRTCGCSWGSTAWARPRPSPRSRSARPTTATSSCWPRPTRSAPPPPSSSSHWAERVGAELVRGQEGADPGSVVFDAMSAATSRGADLVLVDTAGRLHTKVNLMNELEKLRRIVERTPGALKEVLLVLDATTGQNGLSQAREFADAVDVTGVVLTKLDGTAKGGIVLAIEAELGIPVKLIGVGESAADLLAFEPESFVAALLE